MTGLTLEEYSNMKKSGALLKKAEVRKHEEVKNKKNLEAKKDAKEKVVTISS